VSYTDLRDFHPEATFNVPQLNHDDVPLVIKIEKSGGGDIGKAYSGTWRYVIDYDGQDCIYFGQELETGTPVTHKAAARLLARYLSDVGDPYSDPDREDAPTGAARRMCQREYDRLALWSSSDVE
jgi:hypothetical protein